METILGIVIGLIISEVVKIFSTNPLNEYLYELAEDGGSRRNIGIQRAENAFDAWNRITELANTKGNNEKTRYFIDKLYNL